MDCTYRCRSLRCSHKVLWTRVWAFGPPGDSPSLLCDSRAVAELAAVRNTPAAAGAARNSSAAGAAVRNNSAVGAAVRNSSAVGAAVRNSSAAVALRERAADESAIGVWLL